MARAYIGLGSNQSEPLVQLRRAREALAALPGTELRRCSSVYETAPVGYTDQPDFLNAVCCIETDFGPLDLMRALLDIEVQQGRTRHGPAGGPRTLDLDLLLYEQRVLVAEMLQLPHPRLHERGFVLYPLAEIAPDLQVPGQGDVATLLARCAEQQVRQLVRL